MFSDMHNIYAQPISGVEKASSLVQIPMQARKHWAERRWVLEGDEIGVGFAWVYRGF